MHVKTEEGFTSKYAPVLNSTDAVIFTQPPEGIEAGQVCVIIHRRVNPDEPYFNCDALPGGLIRTNEDANDRAACERVIRSKIGIEPPYLEQLKTFSGAARDPRGWSSSVVYFTLIPWGELEQWWATNPPEVALLPIKKIFEKKVSLAFDHEEILRVAIDRLSAKSRYSSLPYMLLGERFTIKQMHDIYDAIRGSESNIAAFRKKVLALGFIKEVKGAFERGPQRPAQIYEFAHREPVLFDRAL